MNLFEVFVAGAAFGLSCVLTWLVRHHAISKNILDIPNARSSHSVPTPRGGGLAVVLTVTLASMFLNGWGGQVSDRLLVCIVFGGGAIAVVGYQDDKSGLRARTRFAVHLGASILAVMTLGGTSLAEAAFPGFPATIGLLVLVLAVSWSINLFNFMDGIDGIAAAEVVFVCLAAAGLCIVQHGVGGNAAMLLTVACSSAGFLVWNWAPARIFMGDVGSGYLGFMLAVMALSTIRSGELSLWTWMILYSVFIADATTTLIRRVVGGARWYEAHRSHAYQHLALRWGSHARVCWAVACVNVVVVFPIAFWSVAHASLGVWLALGSLIVFGTASFYLGAGKLHIPIDTSP